MQEVKIYTASPSDLSPPVQSESFCVDMVLASDYAELEAKYAALAADNDKAMESLKQGDAVVKLAHEKFSALAAENETLKYQEPKLAAMMSCLDAFYSDDDVPERAMMTAYNILRKSVGTPATDAFLAEMRAQAHKEGAYFVANRMLAAWDAGFIDDTAKNAADIARMILTSTEFMADAPEGDLIAHSPMALSKISPPSFAKECSHDYGNLKLRRSADDTLQNLRRLFQSR
ncbi:Eae protein [Salmonella enterica subsp. enterica]|uniref:Eae protein n=3 Tax=Salmonella enterica TaxID=28901 RepID=A0A379WB40_SALET|nr:Eae protein [Salmonella enterica subsp. enterica]